MHKITPILAIIILALVGALLAVGCGGGDAALTKAEFVKQGNAICKKSNEKRNADYKAYASKHNLGLEAEKIVSMFVLPSIQEAAEGLGALAAPKDDEEKVKAIAAGIEEGVKKSEMQIEKEPEGFESFLAPAAKLASQYGLVGCAAVL